MGYSMFFDMESDFRTEEEVRNKIRDSRDYKNEDPKDASLLLIFSTSKQKTWLVSTKEQLYCILDDWRKADPHIIWSIGKDKLIKDGEIIINIMIKDYKKNTGVVNIGERPKGLLYSKNLFNTRSIDESVKDLIGNSILN